MKLRAGVALLSGYLEKRESKADGVQLRKKVCSRGLSTWECERHHLRSGTTRLRQNPEAEVALWGYEDIREEGTAKHASER